MFIERILRRRNPLWDIRSLQFLASALIWVKFSLVFRFKLDTGCNSVCRTHYTRIRDNRTHRCLTSVNEVRMLYTHLRNYCIISEHRGPSGFVAVNRRWQSSALFFALIVGQPRIYFRVSEGIARRSSEVGAKLWKTYFSKTYRRRRRVAFSMKLRWKDVRVEGGRENEREREREREEKSSTYSGEKCRGKKLRIFLADQHCTAGTAYIISSGDVSRVGRERTRERDLPRKNNVPQPSVFRAPAMEIARGSTMERRLNDGNERTSR